jgi:regulator of PEP synthase PpsR (kinase-PPPase family)
MNRRTVFFVSDQTGVTAETMGHSLLTQFDGLEFRQVTLPFIATPDKAEEAVRKINATGAADGCARSSSARSVKDELRSVVKRSNGLFLDFFDAFLRPARRRTARQVE